MTNFTSNTYTLKRKIFTFTNKISRHLSKPDKKFSADITYGMLAAKDRFHKYSVNNTLLLSMQKPDATLVAGFNKWRDGFSRFVKKGEKGIKIIAPTPYKIKEEREKLQK